MPLQATSGAASYDAFGGGVAAVPNYIEDVFSTWLYTGNGSTQTITNGIDLAGKGGLVWIKNRSIGTSHLLNDTARGAGNTLKTDSTAASVSLASDFVSFNTNGFTVGPPTGSSGFNYLDEVSWAFREQPKFFDVVTYTGDGTNPRSISHNLGSTPGLIIVKCTTEAQDWAVCARTGGAASPESAITYATFLSLNKTTAASYNGALGYFPTSTTFNTSGVLTSTFENPNNAGQTYVAYLFAHNAGGFGLTGTDNVISCGSYTGTGAAGNNITLGYEPQWVMLKRTDTTGAWFMHDVMRGMPLTNSYYLTANTSSAETEGGIPIISPTATGFQMETGIGSWNASGGTYIYVAIRRGPMKVPTDGTKVYNAITRSGNSTATTVTGAGFTPDLVFEAARTNSGGNNWVWFDRLRGGAVGLSSDNTGAEFTNSAVIQSDSLSTTMDGFRIQTANPINSTGNTYVYYPLRRAPGFFDEVCYTGTGTYGAANHNLGVTPELVIYKSRSNAVNWGVIKPVSSIAYYDGLLNSNSAFTYYSNDPSVAGLYTSTQFCKYQDTSGYTYVAYLFATCAGVSKVGSYTGTGTTKQVDCGFTGGARFVLIKRTDSTGDWYVWDSARGIVAGNDPYLLLNDTAAEVTSTDYVDTYSAGFEISSTAPAAINASGGTFIFLAIA